MWKNEFLKDGIEYAEKNGMFFIETSAKTADNINQLFEVFLNLYCNPIVFLLLAICTGGINYIYTLYMSSFQEDIGTVPVF